MEADSDSMEEALTHALIEGNVKDVERIIKETTDDFAINCTMIATAKHTGQFEEPTALTIAAEHGHTDCVRKLLEMGEDLYAEGTREYDEEEDEADPYVRATISVSNDYFGALVLASLKGHSEVVQELTEFRLFKVPKIYGEYEEYAKAAKDGDFQKIMTLLESIVVVDAGGAFLKGWKGHNIMNLCLLHGCPSLCLQKMLDCGIGVDGWDFNGLTPLMCAVIGKNLECVKCLLDKGADPYEIHILRRMSFQDDGTVLYINDAGEEMVLEPDFKEEWLDFHQDNIGPTTLMYAAAMGNIPILKLILEAAPKDVGSWGRFERWGGTGPLDFACDYADMEAISLILEYEAAREEVEHEILCAAIRFDKTELFETLLNKNTNIHWSNINSLVQFAMLECVESNNAKYLERCFGLVNKKNVIEIDDGGALFMAIEKDHAECVEVFIRRPEFSVDMKFQNRDSCTESKITCFMFSCQEGKDEFAKKFLEMGANVNALASDGKTAVMLAAHENQVKCLEFLNDVHADFDAADDMGETVFSAALKGDGSCLQVLLKMGKVLDENGLKAVHKESVKVFGIHRESDGFRDDRKAIPIQNIQLLVEHELFQWDWCSVVDKKSMQNLIFVAVTSGIKPGKYLHNDQQISPFVHAIITKDIAAVRYILANTYFSPDDCKFVAKNDLIDLDESPDLAFLVEKLSLQPMSLLTWSTLVASDSLASSGALSDERNRNVDSLPLPTAVKDTLRFKKEFSRLCPRLWKRLGPQKDGGSNDEGFAYLVRNGEVVRNLVLEKCPKSECQCGGQGLAWEDVDGEELNEEDIDTDDNEEWEDEDGDDDDDDNDDDDNDDDDNDDDDEVENDE